MKTLPLGLLLLVPAIAVSAMGNTTPGDTEVSDQAWYLSKDKFNGEGDPHGKNNYAMSQAVPATRQITVNQHTAYFVSAEAATADRAFGRLSWTLIAWCNADNPVQWSMGYWHEDTYTSGGGATTLDCPAGQSETDYSRVDTTFTPTQGFRIPEGAYLAMALWDSQGNMKLHAGEGQSRLVPAADAPDYDAPPPAVDIAGVRSPDDGSPVDAYLYPEVSPGDDVSGLYVIRVDITGSPMQAIRLDVPDLVDAQGRPLPTSGSLRVELLDDTGTVAAATFSGETVVLTGSFLGTYHARLGYDAIGAGPNRILPASTYTGSITVTALVQEPLHLLSDATLSDIGPDTPATALRLSPGTTTTFTAPVDQVLAGTWDLDLLANSTTQGDVTTTMQHVAPDGTTTTIATATTSIGALADIGPALVSDVEADDGELQVIVEWAEDNDADLDVWTHAPDQAPSRLVAPVAQQV